MEDLATLPTPDHVTLLFKSYKSTVVLSVLPDSSFTIVKQTLLAALKSRGLTTLPGSDVALPQDADELELGILKDKKDPSKGWLSLDAKISDPTEAKSGKRKGNGKTGTTNDTPGDVGLVDNSMVAYRLKAGGLKDGDDVDMVDVLEDPGWNVVLPIYEDDAEEES